MRLTTTFVLIALLLLSAVPASAGGNEPTPAEVAEMIVNGTPGEHLLVAAWLEKVDRAEVAAVFNAVRALKAKRPMPKSEPEVGLLPAPGEPLTLINAEVRVIDVPSAAAAAFFGKERPTPKRNAVLLSNQQAQALLRAVEKREDVDLICAPRITVYDGQKANVSVLNKVSYIQDYEREVTMGPPGILHPVVQVIQEGTVVDLRPTLAADGKSISCDFSGTFAMLQRPIPEFTTKFGGGKGQEVTIQIPELRVQRIKTTVTLPDGGWVLIGGGIELEPKKGEAVERVTLVHLRTVEVEGEFAKDLAPGKDR